MMKKCVNIDWLQVYCLEPRLALEHNARFFNDRGFFVKQREYGDPQYKEMFVLYRDKREWLEIRRKPYSLKSNGGLFEENACHIRLCNVTCYDTDPIGDLLHFMNEYGYEFQSITRIDICSDFVTFDDGKSVPAFLRAYMRGDYSKIHISELHTFTEQLEDNIEICAHGKDKNFKREYHSLSWGKKSSAIGVKIYDKTKEMQDMKRKPYIVARWLDAGIITDEQNELFSQADLLRWKITAANKAKEDATGDYREKLREEIKELNKEYRSVCKKLPVVWRVEFSIKSPIKGYRYDCYQNGEQKKVPNNLVCYDTPFKLYTTFYSLAFKYFSFKIFEEGVRKTRCKDYRPLFAQKGDVIFIPYRNVSNPAPNRMDKIFMNRLRVLCDDALFNASMANTAGKYRDERDNYFLAFSAGKLLGHYNKQFRLHTLNMVQDEFKDKYNKEHGTNFLSWKDCCNNELFGLSSVVSGITLQDLYTFYRNIGRISDYGYDLLMMSQNDKDDERQKPPKSTLNMRYSSTATEKPQNYCPF